MSGDPEKLKRETAGRYVSADGRFTVEQASGRWMTIDAETTDELGLPLVRGPFEPRSRPREKHRRSLRSCPRRSPPA